MRGKSDAPFSSVLPRGRGASPRRGVGKALLLGRAREAEPTPELARGVRDHRRREQRDDAQRFEAVAEHRGDRVGVARLLQRPRLTILDVRVRVLDELPHRAEAAGEVELVDAVASGRRTRHATASTSGPSSRASGVAPPT